MHQLETAVADAARASAQIFNYLDRLFHVVKPQRVCYMAIDGEQRHHSPACAGLLRRNLRESEPSRFHLCHHLCHHLQGI